MDESSRDLGTAEVRSNKADMVADVLRHEIAVGIYPAGSDLPTEGRLSARFGVSRPSSREALRVLESEGLIRVARGARGGAKILLPSLDAISRYLGIYLQMRQVKLGDLFSALQSYEPLAVRVIAKRRDQAALSALAQCVAAQEYKTHDRVLYNEEEAKFRALLLAHCGNEVIQLMGSLLTEVYERTMRHVGPEILSSDLDWKHYASGVVAKQKLIKLMAEGDGERAERIWRAYLSVYWRRIASRVGRDKSIDIYAKDFPPPVPPASSNPGADGKSIRRRSK